MKVKHLLHCHLLIPIQSLRARASAQPMPGLNRLLRWSQSPRTMPENAAGWLCTRFGVARQHDWPTAPLAALADGLTVHDGCWFSVDPVHLQLLRDRIVLSGEKFADLGETEAAAFVTTLNQHFSQDGLQFFAPWPNRWYLRISGMPNILTSTREAATGRDIQQHFPVGPDARLWQQRFNDVQMLLHEHPVNQAREPLQALPVNGIWFDGGGTLPQKAESTFGGIWSDRPLLKGLAAKAAQSCAAQPVSLANWLAQQPAAGVHLIDLEHADDPEHEWFVPLVTALRRGQVQSLTLHLAAPDSVQSYDVPRSQRWKFWRRGHPVEFNIHD